ncbi:MAG: hypothetical protein ACO1N5_00265 [Noviherbaspirillum sp.]
MNDPEPDARLPAAPAISLPMPSSATSSRPAFVRSDVAESGNKRPPITLNIPFGDANPGIIEFAKGKIPEDPDAMSIVASWCVSQKKWEALSWLCRNTTLTRLAICDASFDDSGAQALREIMLCDTAIKTLDLSNNLFGAGIAKAFCEGLKSNRTLTTLKFDNRMRGKYGDREFATWLSEALQSNTALTTIHLSIMCAGNVGASALIQALELNRSLKNFTLLTLAVGPGVANALSDALHANATLKNLDLSQLGMEDAGAEAIASALAGNPSLESLDLGHNRFTSKGIMALVAVLKTNSTLKELSLCGNKISPADMEHLADALKANTSLASLNLDMCGTGDDGVKALAAALSANTPLASLSVEMCGMRDDGAKALAAALSGNTSLKTIRFGWNGISQEGAMALLDALRSNTALTGFSMSYPDPALQEEISALLERNRRIPETIVRAEAFFHLVNRTGNPDSAVLPEEVNRLILGDLVQAPGGINTAGQMKEQIDPPPRKS